MNSILVILTFAQAIGFKIGVLAERELQEAGASRISTFALQKYALIGAVIWSIIFIRPHDVAAIFHSPLLIFYLVSIGVLWNIQSYLSSYIANTTSSLSLLSTLRYLLYLPTLLIIGAFLNRDIPNFYGLFAVATLLCAFIVRPSQHKENERGAFSLPILLITGLVLLRIVTDALANGIVRLALHSIPPHVFIGFYIFLTIGICAIWTSFIPVKAEDKNLFKRKKIAMLIPLFWFMATIPQIYAFASLPIYIVVSIGTITFVLDTISDLFRRRIQFNFQTALFILLVFSGIAMAVYAM